MMMILGILFFGCRTTGQFTGTAELTVLIVDENGLGVENCDIILSNSGKWLCLFPPETKGGTNHGRDYHQGAEGTAGITAGAERNTAGMDPESSETEEYGVHRLLRRNLFPQSTGGV